MHTSGNCPVFLLCQNKRYRGRISELNSKLEWSEWKTLGTAIGLTAKYRTSGNLCEIDVNGVINGSNIGTNGHYFGTLPSGLQPLNDRRYQTTDNRMYIELQKDRDLYIKAYQNVSSTTSTIQTSFVYGI